MKWVKVAIGAVIAIISIGIIATSVYNMTQETVRDEVFTFELLPDDTVTNGTYNTLLSVLPYPIGDSDSKPFNFLYNDILYEGSYYYNNDLDFYQIYLEPTEIIYIYEGDTYVDSSTLLTFTAGDTFGITFEVPQPPQLSGISATLILLAPLIFAGGVLAYLLNKQNY